MFSNEMRYPKTTIVATKISVRESGTMQLTVKCPFCDRLHYHGAGFKIQDILYLPSSFGTRCPDCPFEVPLRDYCVDWNLSHTVLSFENAECEKMFWAKIPLEMRV